jgi:cytochrome c biogenesis protein CcmG, thiol:disulfide interchange protein DsbE
MAHRAAQGFSVAVVLALLGVLVWHFAQGGGSKIPSEVAADNIVTAPLFTRDRVDTTGKLSLVSLRGNVVVLNFWQSYCAPCTAEARVLADGYRQWKGKGVVFVGVDEQDLRGPALKFIRRFGITYPIVADDLGLTGHYGVTGYPETYFIDRRGRIIPAVSDGKIIGHVVGQVSPSVLDANIRKALDT